METGLAETHWRNQAQHFIPGVDCTLKVPNKADIQGSSDHQTDWCDVGKACRTENVPVFSKLHYWSLLIF